MTQIYLYELVTLVRKQHKLTHELNVLLSVFRHAC